MADDEPASRPLLVMGWLLAAALLGGVAYFGVRALGAEAVWHGERHGWVDVTGCEYGEPKRSTVTAHCVGDFRSDDGTLRVHGVEFTTSTPARAIGPDLRSGVQESATLAGPDDRTANVDGWQQVGYLATIGAALLAWLTAQLVWLIRHELRRRHTSPAPPAP